MATPRKHWFKVADSIGDEDWDNDVLATLIRLQARLNTKWARNGLTGEEAGKITLTAGDAMAVTHRTSFARALQVLRRCTAAVSLVLHEQRASVKLEWPKWPEFQGLLVQELPESRPLRKTPPQDARRKTEDTPKPPATFALEAPPAPPAPRAGRSVGKRIDPRAEAAWPAIRQAFGEHGKTLGEGIGADRAALITKRIGEGATTEDLVAAVHGYVRNNGLEPRGDFDPRRFFQPQTIFKADGFSDRVDAGRGPRPIGAGSVSKAERLWGHLR